jgi:GAF domain-containing protein
MRTGVPEIIEDTDTEKHRLNPALLREGTRAFCCVPLTLQGKRIGAMSFYYDQPRHFPNFEVDALQLYANQAAAAFDGSQRMAKLESLRYAAEALAGVDGLSEVLQQIVQSAQDVLQADLAAVWPYDPEQQQFVVGGLVAHGALDGMSDHLQQEAPQWRRVADAVMTEQWIGLESVVGCL